MLQQEAVSHTSIKVEPSNGAMDTNTTTTPIPPEFVARTTVTTDMTAPEPMDQDTPAMVPIQQSPLPNVQTVTPQIFASHTMSVAPLPNTGNHSLHFITNLDMNSHDPSLFVLFFKSK